MAELSALKSKRGHIKGKLTRGETFVVGFGENDDIELLKTRKAALEVAFREFEEVQIRMAELNPNDESLDLEFENFENTYFKVIAAINNHLSKRLPVLDPRAGRLGLVGSIRTQRSRIITEFYKVAIFYQKSSYPPLVERIRNFLHFMIVLIVSLVKTII
jgi:hypothetical protein